MSSSRIRVGIDVGGTFTDAVAIDADTLALIGQAKVPTTHDDQDGVARGIVQALEELLASVDATADDIGFLAHGTTQATNALLEGDVATVGIVVGGRGLEGKRAAQLVKLGDIELAPGRNLPMRTAFWRIPGPGETASDLPAIIAGLQKAGAEVIVGAEAYSVDDEAREVEITTEARTQGLLATGTHEITKLYGLRRRTRTAVVNASILPRMLATADMVAGSIGKAGITAPLMVMRCDGGVMSLDEMRRRPLLTILSGPAAGVAGALMNERITDGVFLETGGTSTDVSVIKQGRVTVRYAQIGGHDTYLSSLDVRTVGVGGGSMIRLDGRKVTDVGPRSAHIAGFAYCCYADPGALDGAKLVTAAPLPGDPADYVLLETPDGTRYALTVTCAANVLGLVPASDYAYADSPAALIGFEILGREMGISPADAAEAVLAKASSRVAGVVEALLKHYELPSERVVLVGGGGGAATITPHLGQTMNLPHRIAAHNEVISPLGVAMALVRESVERIIPNPSQEDVLGVRSEAEHTVLLQGADAESIEVDVEIDARRSVVRATATGATLLRTTDRSHGGADEDETRAAAAKTLRTTPDELHLVGRTPQMRVYGGTVRRSGLFGLLGSHADAVAVVDRDGSVVYSSRDATWTQSNVGGARAGLQQLMSDHTDYSSGGPRIPAIRMVIGGRLISLAGLLTADQVVSMAGTDLANRAQDEAAVLIAELNR
ncbi:MAG: N-methylhydantoinase A/acetone carboxylase, beta subunit [Frankiales bacterium]|nr:N-methylhydantoinase A/acetone carboxylase, beta subunit [Frankiales bacterium]